MLSRRNTDKGDDGYESTTTSTISDADSDNSRYTSVVTDTEPFVPHGEIVDLRAKEEAAKQELERTREELARVRAEKDALAREKELLVQRVSVLERKVKRVQRENDDAHAESCNRKRRTAVLKHERDAIKATNTTLEAHNSELQADNAMLEETNARLQGERDTLQSDRNTLTTQSTRLADTVNGQASELQTVYQFVKAACEVIANSFPTIDVFSIRIDEAVSRFAAIQCFPLGMPTDERKTLIKEHMQKMITEVEQALSVPDIEKIVSYIAIARGLGSDSEHVIELQAIMGIAVPFLSRWNKPLALQYAERCILRAASKKQGFLAQLTNNNLEEHEVVEAKADAEEFAEAETALTFKAAWLASALMGIEGRALALFTSGNELQAMYNNMYLGEPEDGYQATPEVEEEMRRLRSIVHVPNQADYALLGVDSSVSLADAWCVVKRALLLLHTDRLGPNATTEEREEASARTAALKAAYESIKKEFRREGRNMNLPFPTVPRPPGL